jgi:chemotaxis signal transduction protein
MAVPGIRGWIEGTRLPKQSDYVRGVLNLRGVMVPIIDLRCRFGQGRTEAAPVHAVIALQVEAWLVGLLADRVLDILSFEARWTQSVPENRPFLAHRFPVRIGRHRRRHDCAGRSAPGTGARRAPIRMPENLHLRPPRAALIECVRSPGHL